MSSEATFDGWWSLSLELSANLSLTADVYGKSVDISSCEVVQVALSNGISKHST